MNPKPEDGSISVRIDKVVYPGRSLAGHQGKALFTDEGLPGELVKLKVLKERPAFFEARTLSILEASDKRREPRCAHYRACSPYQVIDYSFQTELKKAQVTEMLGHELGLEVGPLTMKASPETWGYRNKARFHLVGREGKLSLAYHEPDSPRDLVPVQSCFLLSERMNALLASALALLNKAKVTAVKEVEVRESARQGDLLLILAGERFKKGTLPGSFGPELKKTFSPAGLIWQTAPGGSGTEIILAGKDYIEDRVGGLVYRLGGRSFFQVNRFLLEEAVGEVRNIAARVEARRIADLYCGLGTFGLALAAGAEEVWGVEQDPVNVGFLRQNIRLNGIDNFAVRSGPAEEWLERALAWKPDLVMVDPPRKGLGPRVTDPILKTPPPWLLYLSCDPATLTRDLKSLLRVYALHRLTIYDFFPHTPHIETLSLLGRR